MLHLHDHDQAPNRVRPGAGADGNELYNGNDYDASDRPPPLSTPTGSGTIIIPPEQKTQPPKKEKEIKILQTTPTTSASVQKHHKDPVQHKDKEKEKENETEREKITKKIKSHPALTPLRRRTYLLLLEIPKGRWTTYAVLARHLGTSARAVGTAMRLNPFAPGVPCHRVLGVGGGLGGYMGSPPEKKRTKNGSAGSDGGGNLDRKRTMLEAEGVRFDERGRAMGRVFVEFPTL
ncbi:6-O-methylguanine DNA methyltransferase [Aspergillus egyptiacus]|nr:6-O-methylguanine DNA methyltransferase [Aspergillus egyptiacus]